MANEIPTNNDIAKKVVERNLVMPQADSEQESYNQVSIIRGLSTENSLVKIELRLRGFTYNIFNKRWVKTRKPILNEFGVGNFMATLEGIGDTVNYSNFDEKEINKLALMFFESNYPSFIVYSDDFELNPKDFNVIKTILQFWCLAVLKNAKNAGHRNVVRGTLSEGILARALGSAPEEKKKGGFFKFFNRGKQQQ